jgi:hypothetical protein
LGQHRQTDKFEDLRQSGSATDFSRQKRLASATSDQPAKPIVYESIAAIF